VVSVPDDQDAVAAAIRRCLTPAFRDQARTTTNPYGDGAAAARIVAVIRRAVAGGLAAKPFVDVAPVAAP
jgi:UDP-N-acetylglucosamine 2-epimerase